MFVIQEKLILLLISIIKNIFLSRQKSQSCLKEKSNIVFFEEKNEVIS